MQHFNKFRFYYNGDLIDSSHVLIDADGRIFIKTNNELNEVKYDPQLIWIQIFTGWETKDGDEIYTGDKVKSPHWANIVWTVMYDKSKRAFVLDNGKAEDQLYMSGKMMEYLELI